METAVKSVPAKVGTVLTESDFNTLRGMVKSSDEGNHKVAQQILNQCDVKRSIYWIYKLCRSDWRATNNMVYLRTKASREFRDACELFDIYRMEAEEFADWLIERRWMTQWIFQQLKADIIKDLKKQSKNSFFNLYHSIKPEFAALDPDNQVESL